VKITPSVATSIMNLDTIRTSASFVSACELSVDFAMDSVDDAHIDALLALTDETGVAYTVHAPFRDLNIASLNPGAYEAARADMMQSIQIAARIGATVMNVHPGIHGYYPDQYWPEMKRRERKVYEELAAFGSDHGILVTAENLIQTNVHFEDTWNLDGIIKLYDEWDAELKGVCLDTGHANQAGLDVPSAIRRLGKRIKHLHLQDNHGGPIDEHLPIGEGLIEWDAVFDALEEIGFEGYGVFEFRPEGAQRARAAELSARFETQQA
jgi:sugar phosphate isomerase/epimerase